MAYASPPLPSLPAQTPSPQQHNRDVPYIRWMICRDMPDVLDVDRLSFLEPWTDEQFCDYLRQRNTIGMVVENTPATIAGYVLYGLGRSSLTVHRLAVHPQFRLQGYGRAILEKLVHKLVSQRRDRIVTAVCENDLHAHLFFKAAGFLAAEVNRRQFDPYDGYTFEYRLEPSHRVLASVMSGACRTLALPDVE